MNSQDKELIELAAKAVKLPECGWMGPAFMYVKDNTFTDWNPLKDDGDAFKLAVKLQMLVYPGEAYPWDSEVADYSMRFSAICDEEPDPCAATRKAITRAAAEIGRNMK